MKKLLFIFNPFSGKGKIKNRLSDVIYLFNQNGYEITIQATQCKEEATSIVAKKGSKYDLIVCSGGDGTLNEVVSGLMTLKKKPPVGYIPAGSTNDFGASIGLPKNVMRAAEIVMKGEWNPYDVGQFGNRYFVYVAAFGAFSDVSYMTPQQTKNLIGHQAYVLEAMKKIGTIKPIHMLMEYNDQVVEGDYLFGMISNATSVGGIKGIVGSNVSMDDGLFEVMLVKHPENPIEFPMILSNLLSKEKDPKYIVTFKCAELKIHSDEPVSWTLDGEFGGDCCDTDVVIHKEAVCIASLKKN